MSATFTITLQSPPKVTTVGSLTQVVKQIDYLMSGTENGLTFELPGTAVFPNPDANSFVAFSNLTKEQVTSWIPTLPDALSKQAHIQLVLDKMVTEAQLTPIAVSWAPQPTDPVVDITTTANTANTST